MSNTDIFVRLSTASDSDAIENHIQLARADASQYRGAGTSSPERGPLSLNYVAGVGETIMASLSASGDKGTSVFSHHVFVIPEAREIGLGDALVYCLHLKNKRSLGVDARDRSWPFRCSCLLSSPAEQARPGCACP